MTAPQPDASKLSYIGAGQLDPCALPPLLILGDDGEPQVAKPNSKWTCVHGVTWVAVPVGIRGAEQAQMVWLIQPPPIGTT